MKALLNNQLTVAKWTLFTTLGWLLGFILALLVGHPLENIKLSIFGLGTGISLGVGVMQWVILRKHLANASQWILFSVMGFGGVFMILNILQIILEFYHIKFMDDGVPFLIPAIIGSALGGYISGTLQEKRIFGIFSVKKNNWALTSLVAWLMASMFLGIYVMITLEVDFIKAIPGPLPTLIVFFSVGPILGLITGNKIVSIIENK